MTNLNDVKPEQLVAAASIKLKDVMTKPDYINFVKSGAGKERPPISPDFWFMRSASILRQVYINGPIGVSKLRTKYGNSKGHTVHRKHSVRAGGSIIRDIFQQLEKAELVKNTPSGRIITPKGMSFLDKVSREIKS